MITPSYDKQEIQRILSSDNFIKNKAGFKEDNIKTTKSSSDIINLSNIERQIFISMGQPEGGGSEIVKNVTYDIAIASNRNTDAIRVDSVVEQIIALLQDRDIGNGHILYLLDTPMELSSNAAIYVVEMTFLCQSTVFNAIKK